MADLFPDILRSAATDLCVMGLLLSIAHPKYKRWTAVVSMLSVFLLDIAMNIFFYQMKDYTAITFCTIVFLVPLLLLLKPLFKESMMQWCFNVVTAMNVFGAILFFSFQLSRRLPFPVYSNTIVRVVFFLAVIAAFHRFLRPLFSQILRHWQIYLLSAASIMVCFYYVLVAGGDTEKSLIENAGILAMLCAVMICMYASTFWSLKKISEEYFLQEENLRMKEEEDLMRLSAKAMERRLAVMDEADRSSRILRHDQRHFDAALLELLHAGNPGEAVTLLERRTAMGPARPKRYCENQAVNAIAGYYFNLARDTDIRCRYSMDIPKDCPVDSLELAMALSNLFENAIHGCTALPKEKRFLRCTATCAGQLLISIENSCAENVTLDEDHLPFSTEREHGIGTKSVQAFVNLCGGESDYSVKGGVFRVRLIL